MQMDSRRNHIIMVNLWLSMLNISVMATTVLPAFFGMNLDSGLAGDDPRYFVLVGDVGRAGGCQQTWYSVDVLAAGFRQAGMQRTVYGHNIVCNSSPLLLPLLLGAGVHRQPVSVGAGVPGLPVLVQPQLAAHQPERAL